MSEQIRFFLAVLACMGIMIVWQLTVVEPTQPAVTHEAVVAPQSAKVEAPVVAQAVAPVAVQNKVEKQLLPFTTSLLEGALSNEGPGFTALTLTHYKERQEDKKKPKEPVSLVAKEGGQQAKIVWDLGGEAPLFSAKEESGKYYFTAQTSSGMQLNVQIVPRQNEYAFDYVVQVQNNSTGPLPIGAAVHLNLPSDAHVKGSFLAPPADLLHGVCALGEDLERKMAKDLTNDGAFQSNQSVNFVALDRQYFVAALLPAKNAAGTCRMQVQDKLLDVAYEFPKTVVQAGGVWQQQWTLYMGPKRDQSLQKVAPQLGEVIDYNIWGIPLGFLARPMVFLLDLFHTWTKSWGIAIILLTIFVKLLLFPVTYKSVVSMRRMQLLKPEMDAMRERFKNDRERLQMEQLKMFREKGVNPLGGCLPMLLQMPVWFALYRTLWSAVDLYQQPFLWLSDLTAAEPFPILALILGVVTFVQQKLTPQPTDAQQAKIMMYVMPVILTIFMIALPSGLVLYILVNSLLTIVQQLAINKREVAL